MIPQEKSEKIMDTGSIIQEIVRKEIINSIESRLDLVPDSPQKNSMMQSLMEGVTEKDYLHFCRLKVNDLIIFLDNIEGETNIDDLTSALKQNKKDLDVKLNIH